MFGIKPQSGSDLVCRFTFCPGKYLGSKEPVVESNAKAFLSILTSGNELSD